MTQDEALAEVLRESLPGDVVALHESTCALRRDHPTDETCTCKPLVFVVGAKA